MAVFNEGTGRRKISCSLPVMKMRRSTAEQLLEPCEGGAHRSGEYAPIFAAVQYIEAWISGAAAVPIYGPDGGMPRRRKSHERTLSVP